jgi:hypothetical protein
MTPFRATQLGLTALIVAVFVAFVILIASNDPLRAAHESGDWTTECEAVLLDFHVEEELIAVQANYNASLEQPDAFVVERARDAYYQGLSATIDHFVEQESLSEAHERYLYYKSQVYNLVADMTYEALENGDETGVEALPPAARWYNDRAREYIEGVTCALEGE